MTEKKRNENKILELVKVAFDFVYLKPINESMVRGKICRFD